MENEFGFESMELDKAVESGRVVRVIFANGYQTNAVIEAHDMDVMIIRVKDEKWMVYKRNVSTVVLA